MALFDFPRIHFSGYIDVNVPTINNAFYFPLTIYDATRSESYLPPRLYFTTKDKITSVSSPLNAEPIFDKINKFWYIEIQPINSIELLRTWCMTPIGSDNSAPDAAYLPYYTAADNDLGEMESSVIVGNCPGYWNMYGDMGVTMTDVNVSGVQTFDGNLINTWTKESANIPDDVKPFLNASFNTNTSPASNITSAVMVETVSSQSVYANIFCSNVNLFNTSNQDEVFLQGTPFRFQALIYGAWRVVNWMPPMAGSGRFCSSIPLANIPESDQSLLIKFFTNNNSYDGRKLMGVFVTFTIFEVFENRYNQNIYTNNGTKSNPAQATTVGSITPWYEGDMACHVPGRNLISLGQNAFYINTNSIPNDPSNPDPSKRFSKVPISFIPLTASLKKLNNGNAIFSVDMGNSWPEIMTPVYSPIPPRVLPALRGDAMFETAPIGTLVFKCTDADSTVIASIAIDPAVNPRAKVFETGVVFDFVISDASIIQTIQNNFINGFISDGTTNKQVLAESLYMICTDTKGLYAEQGDLPSDGYSSFNNNRIPCILRIFQKGIPVTTPVNIGVAEYIVPEAANDPQAGPDNVDWSQNIADNGVVNLSAGNLELNNNAVYYFVYQDQYPNNQLPLFANPNYSIMDTGSFAVLRVHTKKDYSMYIDPSHPNYIPPTFNIIYKEVFQMYDVAYPAMALIHPFTAEQWENATMSGLTLQRCDPSMWDNILYMSRSREISTSQLGLLKAWNKYLNKQ
jgi:hypothetical protein